MRGPRRVSRTPGPDIVGGNFAIHLLLRNHKSGLIQFSVGPVTDVTNRRCCPRGLGHGHWSPPDTRGWGGNQRVELVSPLAFPLKEHLSFMEVIYSCGFIMDWWLILERCWRESSGMRTNPAEFCANFRPNVVVILETDKSNTWHKKANKNRHLWQITWHISPRRAWCPVWQINYEQFNGAAKRYFMLIN